MEKIMVILKNEYEKDALGFSIGVVYFVFAVIYFLTK